MRVIYACDIGSTLSGRFAWARISPEDPTVVQVSKDIERLVAELGNDFQQGKSVALGFEAPLFIPVPASAQDLSKARVGEGNRAFSAPAGLSVTTLALHQVAWILSELKRRSEVPCVFTMDWKAWPPPGGQQILLCWEAFVSGSATSECHMKDAATAAMAFYSREDDLETANAVTANNPLSLIGTAALWSSWTSDLAVLHSHCVVIKPNAPFDGALTQLDLPPV